MIQKLFQPVDIASLVFFRIVFGILGLVDVFNSWAYYHLMENAYDVEAFQFYYFGFAWVKVFPEPWMTLFFFLLMFCAASIAAGWRYRLSAVIFFFGFSYLFLLEKAHYLNHGYLFCWISFVMIWLPADRSFSLAVLQDPGKARSKIPAWSVFILPFLMGVVYFFGGIAKLNPDWLRGVPINFWVQARSDLPLIGPLLEHPWAPYFFSYGGLMLDLFIVPLLLMRRTRKWAFLFVLFFHTMNLALFSIGIFPFLSLALTAMFFPPDFPRKVIRWLEGKLALVARLKLTWENRLARARDRHSKPEPPKLLWQENPRYRAAILTGLALVALFHVIAPLRHHLFPGDVAWTEEGHRYAWRMMLRAKTGYGKFLVVNTQSADTLQVDPRKELQGKQARKLLTHPDMILAYAHHLRDTYQEEWQAPVEVYADIMVRLNDDDYARMIDPDVDLARVEWKFFRPSPWILPQAAPNQ